MSLFKKKAPKYTPPPVPQPPTDDPHQQANGLDNNNGSQKSQLVFRCTQAHGSPVGIISGFSNVKELYQKIAECYDFPPDEILFCTLNTHKVDMKKLLGGQIGLEDFIFAHRKGRPKEIEIVKTEDALGLTITDNGAGYAFIKRIKEGSIVAKISHIEVGDHIEKLDGENMVGKRHYEVAKILKDIPKGTTFTIRLVEPLKTGFGFVGPNTSSAKSGRKQNYGSGKETLRFKANGQATIENDHDDRSKAGIEKINSLLESFMGINDSELASQMWDLAEGKTNSMQLADAIDNSDLQEFGFTDEFIIELWGVITDARSGRLS